MKIIKPQKLALLTRVFENDGQAYLVLSAMAFFPLTAPKKLLHEVSLWRTAAEEAGPHGVLDAGMTKHRGEVLVFGKACTLNQVPAPATSVRVQIASIDKVLHVVGDRVWEAGGASDPVPFTEMPITWERAFGGCGFAENPVGRGMLAVEDRGRSLVPLPNIELPNEGVRSPKDRPSPAGFGPLDITWPQRMRHVGTYDNEWLRTRYPGFAKDLNWEHFNVAPEDQRIRGYFDLAAPFRVEGMSPGQRVVEGRLPGVSARLFVAQRDAEKTLREAAARLDTVVLFPTAGRGLVIFRGMLPIAEDDGADVTCVVAAFEDPGAPRSIEHYQAVREKREDRKNGALYTLIDSDLMPAWEEPENAPPDDWADMADLVRTEDLRAAYAERKAQRHIEAARNAWIARGQDPAIFDKQAPKPKPAPKTLDELPAYLEEAEKEKDLLLEQAKTREAEALRLAREQCQRAGIDFDKLLAERKAKAGGPPKLSLVKDLERLKDLAELLKNAGTPSPELSALVSNPAVEERLRKAEAQILEVYRKAAHLLPEAQYKGESDSALAREEVSQAKARGESLSGRDLTGVDLSNMDLSGVDLSFALLEKVVLRGANLSGAKLHGATLARADLRGSRVVGADLTASNFGLADVRETDLSGSDLTDAIFYDADLRGAKLARCKLRRTILFGAKLMGVSLREIESADLTLIETSMAGADLAGAKLEKAVFLRCDMEDVDLSGAALANASFVACGCDGARFSSAILRGARFAMGTSCEHADFKGAELGRTFFRGASLKKADFVGVNAPECDFSEVDFSGADLRGLFSPRSLFVRTRLTGAILEGANLMLGILQKADVFGADLRGANLFRADLAKIRGEKDARWEGSVTTQARRVPERAPSGVGR